MTKSIDSKFFGIDIAAVFLDRIEAYSTVVFHVFLCFPVISGFV